MNIIKSAVVKMIAGYILRVCSVIAILTGLVLPIVPPIPVQAAPNFFTIVVIPDTQFYSLSYPATFDAQAQYIADHKTDLNIAFAIHLGDLVQTSTNATQWNNATHSMNILKAAGVPYSVTPGNHDITAADDSQYNAAFPLADFSGKAWFGGNFPVGSMDSSAFIFSVNGVDFVILNIVADPTRVAATYAWANNLLTTYASRKAIIVSHGTINTTGNFTDYEDVSGIEIWENIGKLHANVVATMGGHIVDDSPTGAHESVMYGVNGNKVYNFMTDYQSFPNGGNGYMRILKFYPGRNEVAATTYSPTLDSYFEDNSEVKRDNQFSFGLNMGGNSSWWDTSWSYRQTLTFSGNVATTNLTSFPVMVRLTAANFDFTKAQSDGDDLRFIASDGITVLPYEIEEFNAVSQNATIWVQVPQLPASSTTGNMTMYYGNASATPGQNYVAVWDSGYDAVYHMASAEDTSKVNDSTTHKLTGSKISSSKPVQENGYIAKDQGFSANSTITSGNSTTFVMTTAMTLEAFVDQTNDPGLSMIAGKDDGTKRDYFLILTSTVPTFNIRIGASTKSSPSGNAYAINTGYHYMAGRYDNTNVSIITVNGGSIVVGNTSQNGTIDNQSGNFTIGSRAADRWFIGGIDEVRISNIARSNDWLQTSYLSAAGALITYSTLSSPTVLTSAATGVTMNKDGVTGGNFNGNLTVLGDALTTVRFQYGLTAAYGSVTANQTMSATGTFSASIPASLTPGATYHFRAVADNGVGAVQNGADSTFTFTMPTVTTGGFTVAGDETKPTLSGAITGMGVASTTYFAFQYSYSSTFATFATTSTVSTGAPGSFTATLSGINPSQTLYYRAIAQNTPTIAYGASSTYFGGSTGPGLGSWMLYSILTIVIAASVIIVAFVVFMYGGPVAGLTTTVVGLLGFVVIQIILVQVILRGA